MGMNLRLYPMLVLLVAEFSISSAQTARFDVFPLEPRLHFKYRYDSRYSAGSLGEGLVYFTTDSGSVEYIVHNSVASGDTAIFWTIENRQSRYHRTIFHGKVDTIFWTHDTSFFTLKEGTSFDHELTSESLVWRFPFQNTDTTQPVFRFSDTTSVLISDTWTSPPWEERGGGDSLWFLNTVGLVRSKSWSVNSSPSNGSVGSTNIELEGKPTLVVRAPEPLSVKAMLHQNYPNPFNPSTTIGYAVPHRSRVALTVYNMLGEQVAVLVNGDVEAGYHEVRFDAPGLASGVYFCRLSTWERLQTRKMLLVH